MQAPQETGLQVTFGPPRLPPNLTVVQPTGMITFNANPQSAADPTTRLVDFILGPIGVQSGPDDGNAAIMSQALSHSMVLTNTAADPLRFSVTGRYEWVLSTTVMPDSGGATAAASVNFQIIRDTVPIITDGMPISGNATSAPNPVVFSEGFDLRPGESSTLRIQARLFTTAATTQAIPEPSTLALVGVATFGGLVYGWRRRKRAAQAAA